MEMPISKICDLKDHRLVCAKYNVIFGEDTHLLICEDYQSRNKHYWIPQGQKIKQLTKSMYLQYPPDSELEDSEIIFKDILIKEFNSEQEVSSDIGIFLLKKYKIEIGDFEILIPGCMSNIMFKEEFPLLQFITGFRIYNKLSRMHSLKMSFKRGEDYFMIDYLTKEEYNEVEKSNQKFHQEISRKKANKNKN